MSKHFIINPTIENQSKETVASIMFEKEKFRVNQYELQKQKNKQKLAQKETKLKHTYGRIVVKADIEGKNSTTFENGQQIYIGRQFNQFNLRIANPVNATVISGENVPRFTEILISHNALHDSNKIFDYETNVEPSDVKYFSIPEADCYAWRDGDGKLQPMKNFCFALRVFEPYKGLIEGVLPKMIKEVLYITTGEFAGNVCHVLKASDYEIVFMGLNGREERLIRCRHFEEDIDDREEITAISHDLTKKVKNNELLIGLSDTTCKYIKDI